MLYKTTDPGFIAMVERGVPIKELEGNMRPGNISGLGSELGFLGKEESLLDVIAADEETVKTLGVTHDLIANKIESLILKYRQQKMKLRGKKQSEAIHLLREDGALEGDYDVKGTSYRGDQECPWNDDDRIIEGGHPYSNTNYTVKNNILGETLEFPGLIVHLIKDHHFYEGIQSPYRVDPAHAVKVLDLI